MAEHDRLTDVFISIRNALSNVVSAIVPPKEIEDIVQETYLRICQVDDEDRIRSPQSFMYRTARNLALDHVKRAESRLSDSIGEADQFSTVISDRLRDQTFEQVCSDERFSLFCDAVRCLPPQCQRVFVLKKVFGYSQREIAETLKLSESTVEKHISMGINRCICYMNKLEMKGQRTDSVADASSRIRGHWNE